jgi:hypothetical protein
MNIVILKVKKMRPELFWVSTLRKISNQRRCHLLRGGRLKSRKVMKIGMCDADAHLRQRCHNSKSVIFSEEKFKVFEVL